MDDTIDSEASPSIYDGDLEMGANIYSLLNTLEYLEQAYIAGDVPIADYEDECERLLCICRILEDTTPNVFVSFAKKYNTKCPLALRRLIKDAPASRERHNRAVSPRNEMYLLFELSEHFITLVDALKLGSTLVEELFPLVHELIGCLKCVQALNVSIAEDKSMLEILDKLNAWHTRLENMAAHEELDGSDTRQLMMDTEAAYGSFKTYLRMKS
ncbi:putative vacuolar sorting protein 28 [Babesia divergens]|uniref:Vacuolar sorting protein 28 n=1 Tax=Babesia divergens TaxID=32595 RepID=A0AAD9GDD2_BABDI|nr:putative vacuolar sorting protein 28 [Babesia divergens]